MGRGVNRSFQQKRYRYIEFGYWHAHYRTKSAENVISRGFPIFGRESLSNDIIISQKRHVLAPKSPKTRCAGDFMPGMLQYQEEGVMATILIFGSLKNFKLKYFSIRPLFQAKNLNINRF